jgi:L-cysteine desulfidase
MDRTDELYQLLLNVLQEELVTAMGCTEPVAIAYAAARARDVLGELPKRVRLELSNNIVKNAHSVVVPNTGGLRGTAAAAAAGVVAGDSEKGLEVISSISDEQKRAIRSFLESVEIKVSRLETDAVIDLIVTLFSGSSKSSARITHYHTNIVSVTKNDRVLYQNEKCDEEFISGSSDRSGMSVKSIVEFAEAVRIEDVRVLLESQIDLNMRIAEEGLRGDWGANVGSVLLETWGDNVKGRSKAMAAAASDARMSGCGLPVVIVSGSGNQGITASIPVIEYAAELGASRENLYRALVVSNLVTVHLKAGIGRLSAYCGAVSAGAGAGAGIAWLHGDRLKEIAHTLVNTLAVSSGIICDGAKPSCAGKIALAVEAAILGFHMFQRGQQFFDGDGIVKKGVENTIGSVARLGRYGMRETDKEILRIMLGE